MVMHRLSVCVPMFLISLQAIARIITLGIKVNLLVVIPTQFSILSTVAKMAEVQSLYF